MAAAVTLHRLPIGPIGRSSSSLWCTLKRYATACSGLPAADPCAKSDSLCHLLSRFPFVLNRFTDTVLSLPQQAALTLDPPRKKKTTQDWQIGLLCSVKSSVRFKTGVEQQPTRKIPALTGCNLWVSCGTMMNGIGNGKKREEKLFFWRLKT